MRVWTTHEEYLVAFIVSHNLVGIKSPHFKNRDEKDKEHTSITHRMHNAVVKLNAIQCVYLFSRLQQKQHPTTVSRTIRSLLRIFK